MPYLAPFLVILAVAVFLRMVVPVTVRLTTNVSVRDTSELSRAFEDDRGAGQGMALRVGDDAGDDHRVAVVVRHSRGLDRRGQGERGEQNEAWKSHADR